MSKKWQGNTEVTIKNIHGDRTGRVLGWHEGYQLWKVEILSGFQKGEIQCFMEKDLERK